MAEHDQDREHSTVSRGDFLRAAGLTALGLSFGPELTVYAASSQASKGSKLDVSYWPAQKPPGVMTTFFQGFTKKTGTPVKYDAQPSVFGDTVQKLTTYLSSGYSGIDVLWLDDFMTASFGTAGWLVPLDKLIPQSVVKAIPKSSIKLSTYNGHLVRIPANLGNVVFYYRKDLFDKAGLSTPRTWNDIVKAGKKLTKGGRYGIGIVGKNGNTELFNEMNYWLPQAGGDVLHLTSAGSKRGLKFMHDLIHTYKIAPPDSVTIDYTSLITNFEDSRIAMLASWDGFLGSFISDNKFWKHSKVAIIAPPKGPVNNSTITAQWGWAINKYSKNQSMAAEFIKYATLPASETLLAKTSSLPANIKLLSTSAVQKYLPQARYDAMYEKSVPIHPRPITAQAQRISDAVEAVINGYLNNAKSLDSATKEAQDRIDQIMRRG